MVALVIKPCNNRKNKWILNKMSLGIVQDNFRRSYYTLRTERAFQFRQTK